MRLFHVTSGQRDDLAGARDGRIDGPPAGHDVSSEEAEEQDHGDAVRVFGAAHGHIFEIPGNVAGWLVQQFFSNTTVAIVNFIC